MAKPNTVEKDRISTLPLEIVLMILSYLPLQSLLHFGETSRTNHLYHILSLKRLRLAVFQRRIHSLISFVQAGWPTTGHYDKGKEIIYADEAVGYTISVLQPQALRTRKRKMYISDLEDASWEIDSFRKDETGLPTTFEQMVCMQNDILSSLLGRYGKSLVQLEFMAYDMDMEGALALATNCRSKLRHLALRFEHPHVRDGSMRPRAWLQPAPSSTCWNALIGIGPYKQIGLTGLQTLILERAGITPWQLMVLVRNNPNLTTLKLRTCTGVHPDFLSWLGGMSNALDMDAAGDTNCVAPGAKLQVLWLENCPNVSDEPADALEELQEKEDPDAGLRWVKKLKCLKSLSFRECMSLPPTHVDQANKLIWNIPEVILPYTITSGDQVEVDPELA
ncbi:hypothetical protein ASPZODRAFT_63287 [Penicilliopsis zonata CBS 506.65]|uniref:F-box domain-containing protein n=1 Tax=Penicilliopsis zonata CBS 506.65 TaxID=1073090 RepID=A0A1L9SLD1_9EURO|nr:hypothetical protein ASPZODRAFT_63287 [Penicilliopsis zonata CBS 506.65]OJJ47931.1 hypothetical protein ASPZODRAFT_63287 [Penicilliopsis zonata CBS 506.65]